MVLPKRIRKFFSMACEQAKNSSYPTFKHGSILVKGGAIVSTGYNKGNYCAFASRFKAHKGISTLHAEMASILGVDKSVTDNAVVYVVRINRHGQMNNSRPCPMCEAAMRFVGIKKCFYSISETEYGVMNFRSEEGTNNTPEE
jgi:deoxycytidylate deaminase